MKYTNANCTHTHTIASVRFQALEAIKNTSLKAALLQRILIQELGKIESLACAGSIDMRFSHVGKISYVGGE